MSSVIITGATGLLGEAFMANYGNLSNRDVLGLTRQRNHSLSSLVTVTYQKQEVDSFLGRYPRIEEVIHCAGVPRVYASNRDPWEDHLNNFDPLLFSLELARKSKSRFVLISSPEVYGSLNKSEDSLPDPESFYGLSKWCCEKYVETYGRMFGLTYQILRPSVLYGNRFNGKGLLYDLYTGFKKGDPDIPVFCTSDSVFNFVHVEDVVDALYFINKEEIFDKIWNIGELEDKSFLDLYQWFCKKFGTNPTLFVKEQNTFTKVIDTQKIKDLGWRPQCDLFSTLERICNESGTRYS